MQHPTINPKDPLVLASRSPRRKRLLEQMGIPFRVVPSLIHEQADEKNLYEVAKKLAVNKALDVRPRAGKSWVLGADTIVEIDGIILGKPEDEEHARQMLEKLSARTHRVLTGFSLVAPDGTLAHVEVVQTEVRVKKLSEDEILGYISTGEPFGKAGSYAIQGIGAFLVESITGSYTNVVGLPVCALIKALVGCRALHRYPIPLSSG